MMQMKQDDESKQRPVRRIEKSPPIVKNTAQIDYLEYASAKWNFGININAKNDEEFKELVNNPLKHLDKIPMGSLAGQYLLN